MPTRRTPLNRAALPKITDEVIALYQRCCKVDLLHDDLSDDAREAYLRDFHRLHVLLGLGPWQECPCDIEGDEPPDWMVKHPHRVEHWRDGQRLKQAIEEAIAALVA